MRNARRLRVLYLLANLVVPLAILVGTPGWWAIAVTAYLLFQVLGVGIGLHRLAAHRSFEASSLCFKFFALVATLTGMGSVISWAGIHRLHHARADGPNDPHDPRRLGLWGILLGRYNENVQAPPSLIRDLVRDPWLVWLHRNYFLVLFTYAGALALFDWRLVLFAFLVPVAFVYWATALGIFLNHTWGYRNFDTPDRSRNSWILSLYTLGDGWHNNHHFQPSTYSHRVKWWEFDACAGVIRMLIWISAARTERGDGARDLYINPKRTIQIHSVDRRAEEKAILHQPASSWPR